MHSSKLVSSKFVVFVKKLLIHIYCKKENKTKIQQVGKQWALEWACGQKALTDLDADMG